MLSFTVVHGSYKLIHFHLRRNWSAVISKYNLFMTFRRFVCINRCFYLILRNIYLLKMHTNKWFVWIRNTRERVCLPEPRLIKLFDKFSLIGYYLSPHFDWTRQFKNMYCSGIATHYSNSQEIFRDLSRRRPIL